MNQDHADFTREVLSRVSTAWAEQVEKDRTGLSEDDIQRRHTIFEEIVEEKLTIEQSIEKYGSDEINTFVRMSLIAMIGMTDDSFMQSKILEVVEKMLFLYSNDVGFGVAIQSYGPEDGSAPQ